MLYFFSTWQHVLSLTAMTWKTELYLTFNQQATSFEPTKHDRWSQAGLGRQVWAHIKVSLQHWSQSSPWITAFKKLWNQAILEEVCCSSSPGINACFGLASHNNIMFLWMNVSSRQQCFTYQRKSYTEAIQTDPSNNPYLVHWDKSILSEEMLHGHAVMKRTAATHGDRPSFLSTN